MQVLTPGQLNHGESWTLKIHLGRAAEELGHKVTNIMVHTGHDTSPQITWHLLRSHDKPSDHMIMLKQRQDISQGIDLQKTNTGSTAATSTPPLLLHLPPHWLVLKTEIQALKQGWFLLVVTHTPSLYYSYFIPRTPHRNYLRCNPGPGRAAPWIELCGV